MITVNFGESESIYSGEILFTNKPHIYIWFDPLNLVEEYNNKSTAKQVFIRTPELSFNNEVSIGKLLHTDMSDIDKIHNVLFSCNSLDDEIRSGINQLQSIHPYLQTKQKYLIRDELFYMLTYRNPPSSKTKQITIDKLSKLPVSKFILDNENSNFEASARISYNSPFEALKNDILFVKEAVDFFLETMPSSPATINEHMIYKYLLLKEGINKKILPEKYFSTYPGDIELTAISNLYKVQNKSKVYNDKIDRKLKNIINQGTMGFGVNNLRSFLIKQLILLKGAKIRRCECCNIPFFPSRSNNKYCNFPNKEDEMHRICKEYAAQKYNRERTSPVDHHYYKVYKRLQMRCEYAPPQKKPLCDKHLSIWHKKAKSLIKKLNKAEKTNEQILEELKRLEGQLEHEYDR